MRSSGRLSPLCLFTSGKSLHRIRDGIPLWQPAKPGPPLSSPHRLSQPIAAMPLARPVKARLTPELEQAVQAWQAGATSVTKLEAALNITHHQAYKLYRQLHELRLV